MIPTVVVNFVKEERYNEIFIKKNIYLKNIRYNVNEVKLIYIQVLLSNSFVF